MINLVAVFPLRRRHGFKRVRAPICLTDQPTVFVRAGTTWTQQAKLIASDAGGGG